MKRLLERWVGRSLVWTRAWQAARWAPPGDVLFSVTVGVGQGEGGGPLLRGFLSLCIVHAAVDLQPRRPWREVRRALEEAVEDLRLEHDRQHQRIGAALAAAGNLKGGDGGHC